MGSMAGNQSATMWFNPRVLRWAREWRSRAVEDAARKVQKRPEDILAWERGGGVPTVVQARTLMGFYDRSFVELFLPDPPRIAGPSAIPDFRMHRDVAPPTDQWELQDIQRWAEAKRGNALDLYEELGEDVPPFPDRLRANVSDDPEQKAALVREVLSFPIHDQIRMTKRDAETLPARLRALVEGLGVMTLRRSELKKLKVRGICIAVFPLPIVVFTAEAPTAQAFSLMHEFGHVMLKTSGITGTTTSSSYVDPVERWSNAFAGSFLMPAEQVIAMIGGRPAQPHESIDDEELARIAAIFRVSAHAMLVRLVHLGFVREGYYWDTKKPAFDQEERDHTSFARSSYYGSRYRSTHGDLYTALVLNAWNSGAVTNHNAAEFLGIKNLTHLYDIRAHFGAEK